MDHHHSNVCAVTQVKAVNVPTCAGTTGTGEREKKKNINIHMFFLQYPYGTVSHCYPTCAVRKVSLLLHLYIQTSYFTLLIILTVYKERKNPIGRL